MTERACTCFGESGGAVSDCVIHRSPLDEAKALVSELEREYPPPPPKPVPTKKVGYWDELTLPENFVDKDWSVIERLAVIGYMSLGEVHQSWRGYAHCRFPRCPHTRNGSQDLTDGVYVWPQGYAHYLGAHGVKPPADFVEHVLREIERRK